MSNNDLPIIVNPWKLAFWGCFLLMSLHAQNPGPDFVRAHITVAPDPFTRTVSGEVRYEFTTTEFMDSIYLDAQRMQFERVELDGSDIGYSSKGGKLVIRGPIKIGRHELFVSYKASPKQTIYFFGWEDEIEGNEQIWTQGQGKDSSHWVPVVDRMDEKVEFDLSILFDSAYQVIANGKLLYKSAEGSLSRWDFDMDNPMSSYLLAFAVGRYDYLEEESGSGIPMKLYYPTQQDNKAKWTYLHSKNIFDFIEADIGIPYPWGDYKQVPVVDFLYAGMENT
ncbi:MAG: M1 family peptidase, partial [Robiginitalea sp.]